MERKIPGEKSPKISVYLARLSAFQEILENNVPRNFRKFKPECFIEKKASSVKIKQEFASNRICLGQ